MQKRNWVADFGKGCAVHLALLASMIALFYVLLNLRAPFPTFFFFADGAEVAGPIAGFFMWFTLLYVRYARQGESDLALLNNVGRRDGERALVCGTVQSRGPLLTAPFSGEPCVGYYYRVTHTSSTGGKTGPTTWTDYEGFAVSAIEIRSQVGDVRLLPEMSEEFFYELKPAAPADPLGRPAEYLTKTDFGEATIGLLGGKSRRRETIGGPGEFRVDKSIGEPPKDLLQCDLEEKIIRRGETAYVVGVYSVDQDALVPDPNIMNTPFHLVKGDERELRRKTRFRYACALVCVCISLAIVAFYFMLYVPAHPGRATW